MEQGCAGCDVVAGDLACLLGVWVSEHTVVLSRVGPDGCVPDMSPVEEHVGTDVGAHRASRGYNGSSSISSIEVAPIVIVWGGGATISSRELDQRVAAVVAVGFRTLAKVKVVTYRTVPSVAVDTLPVAHSPVGVGRAMGSAGVIDPVLAQSAAAFAGKTAMNHGQGGEWETVTGHVEWQTHLDLVVHVLLSQAGHWLLTTHFNADLCVGVVVGSILLVRGTGTAGRPWLSSLKVVVIGLVADGTSLGNETEVILTGAVTGAVAFLIASGGATGQTAGVALFVAVPADTTVAQGTAEVEGTDLVGTG